MTTPKERATKKTPAAAARDSAAKRASAAEPKTAAAPPTESLSVQPFPTAPSGNGWLLDDLRGTLDAGRRDVAGVRRRLRITYAAIVVFSVAMFALGMALVGFPARAFYRGDIDELTFGALAASGAVVLGLLLYFRPLDRLQALVADSTYVTLVKDSFQYQVALRLIALDTDDIVAVERAATYIGEAAQGSMDLVYTQMQARRSAGFSASAGS
jgi:hypothetical protein